MKISVLASFFLFLCLGLNGQNKIAIVIHGGAGNVIPENISREQEQQYRQSLNDALAVGYTILEKGGTSEEAVIATIQHMEEDTLFNAGRGAVFTHEGTNELDASIMSGFDKKAGAVAGVSTIKSPIEAAALVKNKSKHVMMAREGAEKFAQKHGLDMVSPEYFYTRSRMEILKRVQERENTSGSHPSPKMFEKFGTVGCVALDKDGNITAGTSTGGMTNKRFGRIGDSPVIGAGTYAENATCGISCTGHGEYFIRQVIAYDVSAQMKYKGASLAEAADYTIHEYLEKSVGKGGLIGLDRAGNIVAEFNTPGMFRGWKKEGMKSEVKLFKNE